MYNKLKILYLHHFKLVFLLNFALSISFVNLFYRKGFHEANLYQIAFVFKLLGYGITVIIEKLFYSHRKFYFYNLGISYRFLLAVLFGIEFGIFIITLAGCWLWTNFM